MIAGAFQWNKEEDEVMANVYPVNKGINKSMEFKGLKAQYIWYLAGGLVASLILFAVLYVIGINNYVCIAVALGCGGGSIGLAYKLSDQFGEHGLMKRMAKRSVPRVFKSYSRQIFYKKA